MPDKNEPKIELPLLHPWNGPAIDKRPTIICDHCSNPFRRGEGVTVDGFSLCDVCNGH